MELLGTDDPGLLVPDLVGLLLVVPPDRQYPAEAALDLAGLDDKVRGRLQRLDRLHHDLPAAATALQLEHVLGPLLFLRAARGRGQLLQGVHELGDLEALSRLGSLALLRDYLLRCRLGRFFVRFQLGFLVVLDDVVLVVVLDGWKSPTRMKKRLFWCFYLEDSRETFVLFLNICWV